MCNVPVCIESSNLDKIYRHFVALPACPADCCCCYCCCRNKFNDLREKIVSMIATLSVPTISFVLFVYYCYYHHD